MARPGIADEIKRRRAQAVQQTGSTRAELTIFPPTGGIPTLPGGTGAGFLPGGGPQLPPLPGGGGGNPLGGVCDLLPAGTARRLCELGTGFLPGGGGSGNGGGSGGQPLAPSGPCPQGTIRVGNRCVAPGDAFPGGDPFTFPAGEQAVQGAFGLPALTPTQIQRTVRECPAGMVLGKDNLCYPKQVLSRRSRFRKWKGDVKPPVSASDAKAVRRAERVRNKVKDLGKDVGLKVTNR